MFAISTGDYLPCVLEVRRAILAGVDVLLSNDQKFQEIMAMDKVRAARNPRVTSLALYLQDLEHFYLLEMAKEATTKGARVMAYVFDGLYILVRDDDHLKQVYREVATALFTQHGVRVALKNVSGALMEKLDFSLPEFRKRKSGSSGEGASAKSQRGEAA